MLIDVMKHHSEVEGCGIVSIINNLINKKFYGKFFCWINLKKFLSINKSQKKIFCSHLYQRRMMIHQAKKKYTSIVSELIKNKFILSIKKNKKLNKFLEHTFLYLDCIKSVFVNFLLNFYTDLRIFLFEIYF